MALTRLKRSYRFIFPIFCVLLFLVLPVLAVDNSTVNMTEFPTLIGESFNVSTVIAGYLLSSGIMLSVGLALAFLKAKGLLLIMVEFVVLAGCIALGWMPYYLMLVIVLIVALMYADKIKRTL